MFWTVLFVSIVTFTFYYAQTRPKIRRNGQKLRAAPDTLPLLGNAIKFLQPRHQLFDWFVACQAKFGHETLEIAVPSLPPGVVITDPQNLDFVFKNESSITKGRFFKERSWDLFGHGIINASDEMWKAQRKAGLKFFSGPNLDVMVEDVLPEAYQKTVAKLQSAATTSAAVDMQKIFLDLTTSVVGQMAYDMDIDASSPFSQAFDYASDQIGLRFQNPLWQLTEIFTGSRLRSAISEVKKFGAQIVRDAKKRRSHIAFASLVTNDELTFGSLIDSLIESFGDPSFVADSALNFLSAGRDTTAQSFTWTLYAVLRHPEIIPRLRDEANRIFHSSSPLTVASLQPSNIPYTTALFHESLRLYPPVPFELKQCETPITLPDGTFLPATSIVVWCIWAMNRSSTTWGSDANTCRPERWFDTTTTSADTAPKLLTKHPSLYPVFNGGPRACLGKKMAELMASFVLLNLIHDFDVEEVVGVDGKERISENSLTLPMRDGLPCKVRVRQHTGTIGDQKTKVGGEVGRGETVRSHALNVTVEDEFEDALS